MKKIAKKEIKPVIDSVDVVKNGIGNEYYYRIQLVNKPRFIELVLLLIVYYHDYYYYWT